MRYKLIVLILVMFFRPGQAQDCYLPFLNEGISAYNILDFEKAINQFKAAKICDDAPVGNDIDEWINKAQNGYIDAITKARNEAETALSKSNALYLANLSQQALETGDLILAFRLMERAFQEEQNPVTQELILNFQQTYGSVFKNNHKYQYLRHFKTGNMADPYTLIGYTEDKKIHFIDIDSGKVFKVLGLDNKEELVDRFVISQHGYMLGTISTSGVCRVWNGISIGNDIGKHFISYEESPRFLKFSKNGVILVISFENGTLRLIDDYRKPVLEISGFEDEVISTVFSSDMKYIMAVSKKGDCKFFDLKSKEKVVEKNIGMGNIINASFSPKDQQAIFISEADRILITDINLSEDSRVEIVPIVQKTPETIDQVLVSEDGHYVLVLLTEKSSLGAILYDQKGRIVKELSHQDLVWIIFQTTEAEKYLIYRIDNQIQFRKLEKESYRENILMEYTNRLRTLTPNEKLRFGIDD